jgi:hypothetical protein
VVPVNRGFIPPSQRPQRRPTVASPSPPWLVEPGGGFLRQNDLAVTAGFISDWRHCVGAGSMAVGPAPYFVDVDASPLVLRQVPPDQPVGG